VWLGFWAVEVNPSPKFQLQEVGAPVDVLVNCTAWPTTGDAGLKVNEAVRTEDNTINIRLAFPEPELLLAVTLTL
jgi:hypothetical protein